MSDPVEVWAQVGDAGVLAGRLYSHRRGRQESATFTYADTYLARDGAFALDPALPLRAGSYQTPVGAALFAAMTDSCPDRWGRTLVHRAEVLRARQERRAPRSLGEVDLLLGVRDDLRQGALRYRIGDGPEFLATPDADVPRLIELPDLLDAADRVGRDAASAKDLQRLLRVGSSLGGARPKAHVVDADGRLSIAKFPSASSDTWNVMAWEKTALDLASAAGITVPRSTLLDLGGRDVLVVERFDRRASERVGYLSAMTLLEARDGDRGSYLDIAAALEERSPSVVADLHELWRRIVFTVLVSNTDDHLRNHGVLHVGGDRWTLSPAFDVNPDPSPGPALLSMSIDGGDDRARLQTALDVAPWFRLGAEAATAIVAHVSAATSRWRAAAARCGLTPGECEAMAPAFEHSEAEHARTLAGR